MTRAYAVSLIFVALLIASGAFWWQHETLTSRADADIKLAVGVNERVVEVLERSIEERTQAMNALLMDDAKHRFLPIQQIFVEADKARDKFDEVLNQFELLTTNPRRQAVVLRELTATASRALQAVSERYSVVLQEYGIQMDLRGEDVVAKTNIITERIAPVLDGFDRIASSGRSNRPYKAGLVQVNLLTALDGILEDVAMISTGRLICGDEWYFPVFMAKESLVKRGTKTSAKVAIGSYSTALNPENVRLMAGGDTLTINPDGTADYAFTPRKRGTHVVDLRFEIRNPLTGEIKSGESKFHYQVW